MLKEATPIKESEMLKMLNVAAIVSGSFLGSDDRCWLKIGMERLEMGRLIKQRRQQHVQR